MLLKLEYGNSIKKNSLFVDILGIYNVATRVAAIAIAAMMVHSRHKNGLRRRNR